MLPPAHVTVQRLQISRKDLSFKADLAGSYVVLTLDLFVGRSEAVIFTAASCDAIDVPLLIQHPCAVESKLTILREHQGCLERNWM